MEYYKATTFMQGTFTHFNVFFFYIGDFLPVQRPFLQIKKTEEFASSKDEYLAKVQSIPSLRMNDLL